ncbi:MAG: tetratricopeptide repeat protein [Clostridiales bacterium]|nr:tetratricopeptide repeat protein [Clostridiales bacterium]
MEKALQQYETAESILRDTNDSASAMELLAGGYEGRAEIYHAIGKEDIAKQFNQKAIDIWSGFEFEDKEMRDRADYMMALAFDGLGDFKKAVAFADKALNAYASQKGFDIGISLFHLTKVYRHSMDDNFKSAKRALLAARAQIEPLLSLSTVATLLDIQILLADIEQKHEKNDSNTVLELKKAWEYAEKVGPDNVDPQTLIRINLGAIKYSIKSFGDYDVWVLRLNGLYATYIDKGNFTNYGVFHHYVLINMSFFLTASALNNFVTAERALKCLESMKSLAGNPVDIAEAQWLAGCALLNLGSPTETRRAIRLLKKAVPILKESKVEIDAAIAVYGEEYIANYHFKRAEYDLAEHWYREAMKGATVTEPLIQSDYFNHISLGIERCLKRK